MNAKNQKWWILVAMTSAISMIFIDITVLPVALPTIQRSLDISELGLQWIVNAFTLALTVFVLAGGRLGDMLGLRKVFCWGLLLFTIGSAFCGLSNGETWFIFSRLFQGVGGALLLPTSAAIIINAFPPAERGRAMGLYVSIGSVFLAIGPLLGGVFSQYLSWRFIFWINIPIALIGFLLTLYAVPSFEGHRRRFDYRGFITSSLSICFLVIPLMQAKEWGWTSPLTMGMITLGVALFALLLIIDRKAKDPYLELALFKNRTIFGTLGSIFCTQFFLMITVFWAIYFQNIYGYSPTQAGALSLLSNIPIIFAAPLAGWLLDRQGPLLPIAIGFSCVIFALIWFLQLLEVNNIWLLLSAIIPFGIGIPFIFTPSFTATLSLVPAQKRGVASGTTTMLRQFGGSLGLAIFASLYIGTSHSHLEQSLQKNPQTEELNIEELEGLLSKTPEALAAIAPLPEKTQEYVKESAYKASVSAFRLINGLGAAVAVLGLLCATIFIKRSTRIAHE